MFFVLLIAVCISLFNTKVNGQRAHLVGTYRNIDEIRWLFELIKIN
jgi:hypothetical protein